MTSNKTTKRVRPQKQPNYAVIGIGCCGVDGDKLLSILRHIKEFRGAVFIAVGANQELCDAIRADDVLAKRVAGIFADDEIDTLQPGRLYLIDRDASVAVNSEPPQLAAKPLGDAFTPIDVLFRSMATTYGTQAVGVLLDGNGTDGILGIRRISDEGGMTILERLSSPSHATGKLGLTGGDVDHFIPFSEIGNVLNAYLKHLRSNLRDVVEDEMRSAIVASISEVADILKQHTNHDFKNYKASTLVRRIERRVNVHRLKSIEQYLLLLRSNEGERTALFRDLLISVTSFFRDPSTFEALTSKALGELLTDRTEPLRVWVPGCASGEEAFTLAILCDELRESKGGTYDIQIFGTDIDTYALDIARQGTYPLGISNYVSTERLTKYFVKRAGRYQLVKRIREMCMFSVHNLISDPPFSKLDLICCRNLLIYLGTHLQVKLMPLFHFALKPNGFLFLGPSENLSGNRELFREIDIKSRIWQRKRTAADSTELIINHSYSGHINRELLGEADGEIDLRDIGQRIILGEFAPEWSIVNEDAQILNVSEEVGQFLRIGGGTFENNIIKLAKAGVRSGLRAAFAEAVKRQRRSDKQNVSMRVRGGLQRMRVTVQPMPRLGSTSPLYLIVFQKEGPVLTREELDDLAVQDTNDSLIAQLEKELASTRDDLEKSVQDLETLNEELKSSNEELLSMNEELQTANEELETSKEEIKNANAALLEAKTDLENLLRSTDIATVFLDKEFRVKGFTQAATAIYNLIDSDIGRPLWHLTQNVAKMPNYPSLEELTSDANCDALIATDNNCLYSRKCLPYRNKDDVVEGMVIVFNDITTLRLNEEKARLALNAGHMGTWQWDTHARTLSVDAMQAELLFFDAEEAIINEEVASERLEASALEELVDVVRNAISEGKSFRSELRIVSPAGTHRWLSVFGSKVPFLDDAIAGVSFDITTEKEISLELERKEAFTRAILENSPDCVKVINREGQVLSMNANGCRLMDVENVCDIQGKAWVTFWPPEFQPLIRDACGDALSGRSSHFQAFCPTAKGVSKWWDVIVDGIRDQDGNVDQILSVSRDITKIKQSEFRLLESRNKLQAALEVAKLGSAVIDHHSNKVVFDELAAEILGLLSQHPYPRTVFEDGLSKNDQEEFRKRSELALQNPDEEGFSGQWTFKTDKGLRWLNIRKRFLFNEERQVTHGLMAIQDITELKEAEIAALRKHELLSYTLAAAHAGVWEWDLSLDTLSWSPETYRLLGFDPDQSLTPTLWPSTLIAEDRVKLKESIDAAIENGAHQWNHEFRIQHPQKGVSWILAFARIDRHKDGSPNRLYGIYLDITARKQTELALEGAKSAAEAANLARGEFLANMSHEIRTPMTAILGHVDILADHLRDPDNLQCIDTIRRNGRHLLELINDILDLSKIDAGYLELCKEIISPPAILADVRSLMEVRAAEKRLVLEFAVETLLPEHIETDVVRLRQILFNLIGNAIKFTETGGVKVSIGYQQSSNLLQIAVRDTGIGISPGDVGKLFSLFSQIETSASRKYEGTGLGLAISQRLARALGGDIQVATHQGQGSCFTVSVDCGKIAIESALLEVSNFDVVHHDAATLSITLNAVVLVVDDRRDIRYIAQHFIERAGGRVITATNGKEAIEFLMSPEAQAVDAVVMDMQMPVMDGYEATSQLRSLGFSKPIIALTANAMKEDRVRCLEVGCTEYTSKPLDGKLLIELLAKTIRHTLPG